MLPRKYRITKEKEYKKIFEGDITVFSRFIIIKGINNDLGFDRFGFIVSLKVSKKACQRIKIKRRLRESAKKILRKKTKGSFDIAVIAKKGAFEASFNELDNELKNAFAKIMQIYERKKSFNKNNKNISGGSFS